MNSNQLTWAEVVMDPTSYAVLHGLYSVTNPLSHLHKRPKMLYNADELSRHMVNQRIFTGVRKHLLPPSQSVPRNSTPTDICLILGKPTLSTFVSVIAPRTLV